MGTVVAIGWFQSPTAYWHHETVYAAVKGVRTDCGMRTEPRTWWLDLLDSRHPREGWTVCQRCERKWAREAG